MQLMTVYSNVGSNATRTARLMLDHKGLPYKVVTLPNELHRPMVRRLGFPGKTVPAIKLGAERFQGNLAITRILDEICPEPPLFPEDPELRARVELAEAWADEVIQTSARKLIYAAVWRLAGLVPSREARRDLQTFFEGPMVGVPVRVAAATAGALLRRTAKRIDSASDASAQAEIARLPELLDYVEALLREGTIGGDRLYAADYAIAPNLCLIMTMDDLRPFVEPRPAGQFARRVVRFYPGRVRPVLPDHWLEPLREARVHEAEFPA